jgi:CRISPR-associated protein Cmr5
MRTLDQIRAEYAWGRVQNPTKEYRNLAKSLPALIMSNGLIQSLAFLQGKGRNEHKRLLEDVRLWLLDQKASILPIGTKSFSEAMTALTGMPSVEYQRATEESLAILRWIRYLVDTVIGSEPQ